MSNASKRMLEGAHQEETRVVHNKTMATRAKRYAEFRPLPMAVATKLHNVASAARLDAENTGGCVVHVKDGKPLTAQGARLLGVKWPVSD